VVPHTEDGRPGAYYVASGKDENRGACCAQTDGEKHAGRAADANREYPCKVLTLSVNEELNREVERFERNSGRWNSKDCKKQSSTGESVCISYMLAAGVGWGWSEAHSQLVIEPVKLRLPFSANGFSVLETTLVGTSGRFASDESAKGALVFVERSTVVPGIVASKGCAGGTKAGG
jgi:hypothetical protein